MPNGKCYMHGGATPGGAASPHFKHGRYSKHLPTTLAQRYEAAVRDPDLLSLSDDIAVLEVRLGDMMDDLSNGDAALVGGQLKDAYSMLVSAHHEKNAGEMEDAILAIGQAIRASSKTAEQWRLMSELMEQRRKLADTERKRRVDMQTMVSAEQVYTIVKSLAEAVRSQVNDRKMLQSILGDFERVMSVPAVGGD
ncbi:MAG: hypothetical protein WBA46_14840 [Thermomicrobiales bacterium]